MKYNMKYKIYILVAAGFLFSSYMSGVKFFTSQCALGETCPLFMGYPACYFGFGLFTALAVFSLIMYFFRPAERIMMYHLTAVSIIGTLFAGHYAIDELPRLFAEGFSAYALGLPTCVLGAVFFLLIATACVTALCRGQGIEQVNA